MKEVSVKDVSKTEVKYTREALGFGMGADGEWKLVSIPFDAISGKNSTLEVVRSDKDRNIIIEAFKIRFAQNSLGV